MDNSLISLQAKLDKAKSKYNINKDIDALQRKLDKLKLQANIDPNAAQTLAKEIEKIINQKIVISNIEIDHSQTKKSAQQTGQKIGNAINQGVVNSVSKTTNSLKSGSESFVQHLNEAKNISNVTGEELNAQKEKLVEQEKYYSRIKEEVTLLYDLEQKLLSADELQTAELDKQIKSTKQRITYNNQQIDKKNLRDNFLDREITNLEVAKQKQLALSSARIQDSTNIKAVNEALKEQQSLQFQVNEIQLSMSGQGKVDYNWQVDEEIRKLRNLGVTEEEVAQKVKVLTDAHTKLKQVMNSNEFDSIESKNRAIIESDKERALALNQVKNSYKELKTDASQYYNINKQTELSIDIQNWLSKNSHASKEAKDSLTAYYRELSNGRISVDRLNYIEQELNNIDTTQRSLGKIGKKLKDQFSQVSQSFSSWLSVTSGITLLVNKLRKMPQEVISVNSALVELNKVSDASVSDIKKYFDETAISAKDLGTSVSDLITATADWSRLGYSLPDSKKLAEIATLYKNIGDGIDLNTANESLVSTLQGFNLDADDAMHIIDAFNEVGKTYIIGNNEIGEALRISASSMYAAGNTLEETIGLVTAANTVVQDPDSIGTAYKTLSMRIRGAKTEMEELGLETDGMVESTATLREEIMALSGVDIMKDKDTFKSTYQILDELALKWQDLTDIQRDSISELIAGKKQGNIISALMSNFDIARQATETAINSTGSALKEQEKYEQGIQYSLDRLEASFQSLSNTVLDSDLLKGIVDLGTEGVSSLEGIAKALEYINSLFGLTDSSTFGALGAASGLIMNKMGIGERTMFQW